MTIPHSKPLIDQEEITAVTNIMQRGEIAIGPEIEKFEQEMAQYIGKKYAIAVSNGTSAIHLSLLALNIKEGDEVILPASICPGVLHGIEYTGATPILCDTNPYDLNLSYDSACKKITPRTKAIILPHLYGIPADIERFNSLDIPIIEDCAQSLGATHNGALTGSFGELSIFSFYATKMITSIDGGMILTNKVDLADRMKDLRYYAGKKDYKLRYNYKMQNINAVIGLVQLQKLESFLTERKNIFNFLTSEISDLTGVEIITENQNVDVSSHYKFLIKFKSDQVKETYLNICKTLKISTGISVFVNLHYFKHSEINQDLQNLHAHMENTYSFPIYPGIDIGELKKFTTQFKEQVGKL